MERWCLGMTVCGGDVQAAGFETAPRIPAAVDTVYTSAVNTHTDDNACK